MVKPSLHTRECEFDFPAWGFLCLLHKSADHNQPPPLRRKIDGAGNAIVAAHAYFPELAFQVVNMRLRHLLWAKVFKHLRNAQEVGAHVIWQALQLGFCLVGDFYVPAHEIL
jgi:hypothetical protein